MSDSKRPASVGARLQAGESLSARLMKLANQTAPVAVDFEVVRDAVDAERTRRGAVAVAFMSLARQDALEKEVADSRRAVAAEPNSALARMRLADALRDNGDLAESIELYRNCTRWPETAEPAGFFLAALGAADLPPTMPPGLVRETFDHYAPTFEQELVGALRYQGPALLHQAVLGVLGPAAGGLDILDGGCGTGLCGKVFRPMARRLVGVDASAEMIRRAGGKDFYDELIHGELCETLGRYRAALDLVIAGDLLIYLGDPDPVMAAAWTALEMGGLFALTTERFDGAGFDLPPTGRFRHSDSCIEQAASNAGFDIVRADRACLRFERGVAVDCSVFVLSKRDRASAS